MGYYQLLARKEALKSEYKYKRMEVKEDLRKERIVLHKQLHSIHKNVFRWLDIALVLVILLNFGAVVMTNALVVKATPDIQLTEANPIMAEVHDFAQQSDITPEKVSKKDDWINYFNMFIKFILLWCVIVFSYVWFRRYVFTEEGLYSMTVVVTSWLILLAFDFFNDFGYMLGKWLG